MKEHIVRSFEQELRHVGESIARMGVVAEEQLQAACALIGRSDPEAVRRTVERDEEIDRLDLDVARSALRLLALRQPLAVDLRETLVAIKVSGDLERIGDLAKNIAKRAGVIGRQGGVVKAPPALEEMGRMVRQQLDLVVGAYADRDAARAEHVWRDDERLDDWYESLFRELLTYMMEDPRTIASHTHLLFIAKNLERVGDHCANVGASVYYLVTGEALSERRPKGADARLSVVDPPGEAGAVSRIVDPVLEELRRKLLRMGSLSEAILDKALRSVWERDAALAREVRIDDLEIDRMDLEIDEAVLRTLALQAPKANDLRSVIAVKMIATDLERVGDLARNIAKSGLRLSGFGKVDVPPKLLELADHARRLLRRALDSFSERDTERAAEVLRDDDEIDRSQDEVIQSAIREIATHPELTSQEVDFILIAKNLERVADHATNIAEDVILVAEARNVKHAGKLAG